MKEVPKVNRRIEVLLLLGNPYRNVTSRLFPGTPLTPGTGGSYGLWIGRGNAEFSKFRISDVVKPTSPPPKK